MRSYVTDIEFDPDDVQGSDAKYVFYLDDK